MSNEKTKVKPLETDEEVLPYSLPAIASACNPIRFEIMIKLRTIKVSEKAPLKGMYINQIATEIGKDRRLVSFHLNNLEYHGIVKSELGIIEELTAKGRGRAGKFYMITELGQLILGNIWTITYRIYGLMNQ